jgi:hypothetical protein
MRWILFVLPCVWAEVLEFNDFYAEIHDPATLDGLRPMEWPETTTPIQEDWPQTTPTPTMYHETKLFDSVKASHVIVLFNESISVFGSLACLAGQYDNGGTCASCTSGKYSVAGSQTACTNCPAGGYSGPGWGGCNPCPAGYFSGIGWGGCNPCPVGYYSGVGWGGCYACATGKYNPDLGKSSCIDCAVCDANYYNAGCGKEKPGTCTVCTCEVNYYTFSGCSGVTPPQCVKCRENTIGPGGINPNVLDCLSVAGYYGWGAARACEPGYYCPGDTIRYECTAGVYTSGSAATVCSQCLPGTYNDWVRQGTGCEDCKPGQYSMAFASTVCTACSVGLFSNYSGASTCLACPPCDSNEHLQYNCTISESRICCSSASIGYFKSGCSQEEACPSVANAVYQPSQYPTLNGCGDFKCNSGFFGYPSDIAGAKSKCASPTNVGLLFFGIGKDCSSALSSVCKPYSVCKENQTELRYLPSELPIINSATSDIQCTNCQSCVAGTQRIGVCTPMNQTACAKCQTSPALAYEHQGQCVSGVTSFAGYYPVQFVYPITLLQTIVNNTIVFPRKQFVSSDQLIDLSLDSNVMLNAFVPCASPPEGYKFKTWNPIPGTKTVTMTSFQYASEPCDREASMECIDYSASTQKGWFRNASQLCQPCTRSSPLTTCTWNEFRDLTTCTKTQDSQCVPCRGTLPLNGVWTLARSPYYFDSNEPMPCQWDCNAGYYRDESSCLACTNKPENANYDVGPFRIGNTVPNDICLNNATCKYFGGTKVNGCMWKCAFGYQFTQTIDGVFKCAKCDDVVCSPGEVKGVDSETGCPLCQQCSPLVANATYGANCEFSCNAGFYKSGMSCVKCSVRTCPANFYSGGCSGVFDSSCVQCSTCAASFMVYTPCTSLTDTVCAPCTKPLLSNSMYDSMCNVVCIAGYVMVNGTCKRCAQSNADCSVGTGYNATCTPENLGCTTCRPPQTLNWCWTEGSSCAWDCIQNYRKNFATNVCVYDTSKYWSISCLSVPITTPAPSTTTTTSIPSTTTTTSITTSTSSTKPITTTSVLINPTTSSTSANPVATTSILMNPTTSSTSAATTSTLVIPTTSTTVTTTSNPATSSSTSIIDTTQLQMNTTTSQLTETPTPASIVRETLNVANITISECACRANQTSVTLSALYNTSVFVVSCEEGTNVVVCENFTCPCTSRRLLQISEPTTQVNVVYTQVEEPKNQTQVAQALELAYQKPIVVIGTTLLQLPSASLVWNPDVIFYKPALSAESFPTGIVIGAVLTVFVLILLAILVVYLIRPITIQPEKPSKPVATHLLNVKIRSD